MTQREYAEMATGMPTGRHSVCNVRSRASSFQCIKIISNMPSCVVKWCKNNSTVYKKHCGITFHKFPNETVVRDRWTIAIRESRNEEYWLPSKHSVVCSIHFEECDTYYTKSGLRRIKKNAIPKKVVNLIDDPDVGPDDSAPDFNAEKLSQQPDTDRDFDDRNLNAGTSSEHMEDVSRPRVFDSSPDPIRDSELESIFDTPKKSALRKQVKRYKMRLLKNQSKIRTLHQRARRLTKRNECLKNILKQLKEKNYIDTDVSNILDENVVAADLFNNINKKILVKKKIKYSAAIKRFCLTLNFYSPKAYDFVRKTFQTCLPHHKTLSKWYAHINGEPGFTDEAFTAVKQKAETSEQRPMCALIFDEMALRQQKIWDGRKYQGLVDMGTGTNSDSAPLASQAFVFLLVAINQRWKIPLGYFLTNSLTGEQKANLIKMCLIKCFDAGVDVVSLTFDGHATNFSAMELLNCNVKDLQAMKTKFKHPSNDTYVHCFLDPCHVIKLVRNQLQCKKEFLDINGDLIKWDYLIQLNTLQDDEGIHLANKLSKRHINFRNQIMKVKLAVQLLSRSVATALKICREDLNLQHFEQSVPTEQFIQKINDFFDIFNSRAMTEFDFKKPINANNKNEIFLFLDGLKEYISNLKLKTLTKRSVMKDGRKTFVITRFYKPLLETKCKTGFLGILINIESLKSMFSDLIEKEHSLVFLPTYKLSQDHLEIFFGSIRMHGGHNDNPNVKQFKGIYRKLLTHLELKCLTTGNCVSLENIAILNCDSGTLVINSTSSSYRFEEENENFSLDCLESIENIENLVTYLDVPDINDFRKYVIGYIAGAVAHYLTKKLKCELCVSRLLTAERHDFHKLITLRDKGGLSFPSFDTYDICCTCELVIRKIIKERIVITSESQHKYILSQILKRFIGNKHTFLNLENDHNGTFGIEHQTNLIRCIIEKFINIRFHHIAKQESIFNSCDTKRQYYKKLTQHKGH